MTQNFFKTIKVNLDVNYRQFEDNLLFLPKRMLRAALVGKTKSITIGVNRYRNYDYFLSKQFFDDPNDNYEDDQGNDDI